MARAIDGELLELEIANIANKLAKSDAQKALMGRVMYCVEHMPTLTPPNKWVSVENAMPPEHEPVLCIASGSPKPNITLEDAYQFGSWNKADGWIIDEYLDWEDADVSWWMPLPTPPDGRPPEVSP